MFRFGQFAVHGTNAGERAPAKACSPRAHRQCGMMAALSSLLISVVPFFGLVVLFCLRCRRLDRIKEPWRIFSLYRSNNGLPGARVPAFLHIVNPRRWWLGKMFG
jgi:hypothetical protein